MFEKVVRLCAQVKKLNYLSRTLITKFLAKWSRMMKRLVLASDSSFHPVLKSLLSWVEQSVKWKSQESLNYHQNVCLRTYVHSGILQESPFDRKCDCIFIVAFQKKNLKMSTWKKKSGILVYISTSVLLEQK